MKEEKKNHLRVVSTNRKARALYQIIETYEAGIELRGNEVKSLRMNTCSLDEGYALVEEGEIFIYNMHIPEFAKSFYFKSDPARKRKLLLHKKEIKRLMGLVAGKGLTIIPLKVYFNLRGLVKIEIALAKGQKVFDKRKRLHDDAVKRDVERELKDFDR